MTTNSEYLFSGGGGGGVAEYQIQRSVRFNSADSAHLSWAPGSAGNRKTWTWSGWVKRSALGSDQYFFTAGASANQAAIRFDNVDKLELFYYIGYYAWQLKTAQVFRDLSSWYHIVAVCDTDNAVADNRMRLYVNGTEITVFSNRVNPGSGSVSSINLNLAHAIGSTSFSSYYFNGYLSDIHFIDGQALDPTSFGEFDTNGVWQPKAYSGGYGTNGFHLDFSDNSTAAALGTDTSGNGNTWTVNNISVAAGAGNDSLVDTPTNYGTDTGLGGEVRGNYATLNPLAATSVYTLTNGNLKVNDAGTTAPVVMGTFAVNSGKWYWEVTLDALYAYVGAAKVTSRTSVNYLGAASGQFMFHPSSKASCYINGVIYNYATASTATTGDVIGVALDFDANQIVFYKNGVSMGVFGSNVLGTDLWAPAFKSNTASQATFNFGQRPFAYTAPSGFKALCTQNLPDPTIADGSTAMDVALYTGNNSTNAITGLGFSPDLVWIKARSSGLNHVLFDTVRTRDYGLYPNLTNKEPAASAANTDLASFDSTGFTLGGNSNFNVNDSGVSFAAWTWDAGSSTVTNNDGSITSQVRANPSAGFSVVTWNGSAANATIGHGLGTAPQLIIRKYTNAVDDWYTYHASVGTDKYVILNSSSAELTSTSIWQSTSPTSSVFYIGAGNNNNNSVAYCFAPVEGYSAFGSYTGNGSADGPFVYTGFRPAFVMIKYSSATGGHWMMYDSKRGDANLNSKKLAANLSALENDVGTLGNDSVGIDYLSNGFKIRTTGQNHNVSAGTYIYAAFAENPFKTSRAR